MNIDNLLASSHMHFGLKCSDFEKIMLISPRYWPTLIMEIKSIIMFHYFEGDKPKISDLVK